MIGGIAATFERHRVHGTEEEAAGDHVDDRLHTQALPQLTKQERRALQGLINGESVRGLGLRMAVSEEEASAIRTSMKRKLGARSDADAIRIALTSGTFDAQSTEF